MKKALLIFMSVVFLMATTMAFAEVVHHSGSRGVNGKLGDTNHVWEELHVQDIVIEGATEDAYETTLSIEDPSADRTFNLTTPKRITVPLGSVFVDGSNDIDDGTAPNLTTLDNVGAILYDNSGETAEIQFNWAPSANYVSGMQLELVCSSDSNTGSGIAVDWVIFVQDDATAFGTSTAQTGATLTSAALATKNEVVTLSLDATGEALITAGSSIVTIGVFNASTTDYDLEIKAITILEP